MKLTRALDNTVAMVHSNIFVQSTKKTYGHYLVSYRNFCKQMGIPLIPLTPINLGRYIAFLSSRLSLRSMWQYVSIVRLLHVEAGYRDPNQSQYIISLFKGAKRVLGDTAAPKLPITPDILKSIFTHLDFRNTRDITFWAACLAAFFSFFRKSNLFVHSLAEFKPAQHLTRESVSFHTKGMVLTVTWTKTIQFRQRTLHIPLPRIPGSFLCPAQALLLSMKMAPAPQHSYPLHITHRGVTPLTYAGFLSRLKQCLQLAGIPPTRYSGHSFRRGGATFALECGIAPDLIYGCC